MNNENKEKNVVSDEMTTELEKADATQSQAFEADSHTMIVQESVFYHLPDEAVSSEMNDNVNWVSSDPTVAAVNPISGLVCALKPGRHVLQVDPL